MTNLLTSNSILSSIAGSAVVSKILSSSLLMRGTLGGVALTAAGFALVKMSHTKKGIELRKKLITGIRDKADKAIESLDKTAREMEHAMVGAKKTRPKHSAK